MSRQLPLQLDIVHTPSFDDFIVGGNRPVISALSDSLHGNGEQMIFLSGPSGSGRSHLLMAQCTVAGEHHGLRCGYLPLRDVASLSVQLLDGLEMLDLVALDDVDAVAGNSDWELALFALFNRCRERQTRMLFSGNAGPAALPIALADLRSRLCWGLTLSVSPLDDRGRLSLLQALAARRALSLSDEVARYLLDHGPRHPSELVNAVDRLDKASLAEQRRLTIPFVRDSLHLR